MQLEAAYDADQMVYGNLGVMRLMVDVLRSSCGIDGAGRGTMPLDAADQKKNVVSNEPS